ncbi:MAG: hypothetical protein CL828_08110, partial [Crocinitomicaceae bacterium]|nr:hypothetical protein [Crocinitomicaceae bacterium]
FTKNSIAMKCTIYLFSYLLTLLIHATAFGQHEAFAMGAGASENCISLDTTSPDNTYTNRRQLLTSCSNEDFMALFSPYALTCAEVLVGHFHCDICFNQSENSLTSYDGRKFYFDSDVPTEITKECLSLISDMRMGSLEHSKFLKLLRTEHTD